MASLTSFFPRNAATSRIFLQTNLLDGSQSPFFSSPIRHPKKSLAAQHFFSAEFHQNTKNKIKGEYSSQYSHFSK
jgi:hypothetical protein